MHSCATLLSDAIGSQAVSFLGPNELQALILVTDQPEASVSVQQPKKPPL